MIGLVFQGLWADADPAGPPARRTNEGAPSERSPPAEQKPPPGHELGPPDEAPVGMGPPYLGAEVRLGPKAPVYPEVRENTPTRAGLQTAPAPVP